MYKEKYITLNRALSYLKRGIYTKDVSAILGVDEPVFNSVKEYLVLAAFSNKEKIEFIKLLNSKNIDLYRLAYLKDQLNIVRTKLEAPMNETNIWNEVAEKVLDAILNGREIVITR